MPRIKKSPLQPSLRRIAVVVGILVVTSGIIVGLLNRTSDAASLANWDAGRIIDDSVMVAKNTMTPSQIQLFLNSKVPACDTNGQQNSEMNNSGVPDYNHNGSIQRWEWGKAKYSQTTFTCLRNFSQGGKSAARIIYDIAQQYTINPRVLIVLLQKEQGLVTDTWPLNIQYRSATGYGCPDTAACDSNYYGFTNQVTWAAKMFRSILNQSPNWYSPYVLGNNYIRWSPTSSCGGSTVNIRNLSTVALYDYTPYQPNQAALNAGYGMGNGCSSYGNRNFYLYFVDWFGSTRSNLTWDWTYASQSIYNDAGYTSKMTSYEPSVTPNGTIYAEVKATNSGNMTWDSSTRLGTNSPQDRTSQFYDSSWISSVRAAGLQETSVAPGMIGTFRFELHAPATAGTYREHFNLVQEGMSWFNDPGLYFSLNVTSPVSARNAANTSLAKGNNLMSQQYLLSPDMNDVLILQGDGNLVLYDSFRAIWSSGTAGSKATRLTLQNDGNLVLYTASGKVVWHTETAGSDASSLKLQTDGNLVLYNPSNAARWNSNTHHAPDNLSTVTRIMPSGGQMYIGQRLETAKRDRYLLFQSDGNLVLYTNTGTALWNSRTSGKGGFVLQMQPDGNLVLYAKSGKAVWYTKTANRGISRLELQQDSNLVLYKPNDTATWSTNTDGL